MMGGFCEGQGPSTPGNAKYTPNPTCSTSKSKDWYNRTEDFHGFSWFSCKVCLGCAFGDRWGEATITCQKEQTNGSNELDVHIYNSRPARRTCRIVHRVSLVGMSLAVWQSIFPGSRRQELSWHIKAQVISCRIFGNRAANYIRSMTMPLTVSAKEYRLMTITFERHQEIGTIFGCFECSSTNPLDTA